MRISAEHICLPMEGESANGDAVLVRNEGDTYLLAVVDSLGHGAGAEEVSVMALAHLTKASLERPAGEIMQGLHDTLRGSRGAAAMLCIVSGGKVEGCGVGNVELRVLGCALPVVQSPGILGSQLRKLNVFRGEVEPGARLIMFSDGIEGRVPVRETRELDARDACRFIVDGFRRTYDDTSVLVADVKE